MYEIAIKMLLGDRAKLMILISSLTVASLLITQQSAIFLGLMRWTTASLRNAQAPIWVVDPKVEQVNEPRPMRDTDLARVKSVEGVEWASPFFQTTIQAKLNNGRFKNVYVFGIDPVTLYGIPSSMVAGNIQNLRQINAVIIDENAVDLFSEDKEHPIGIGYTFEINDHEARVVGIVNAQRTFVNIPYVYTTYDRALEIVPKQRKNLSFILVQPRKNENLNVLAKRIGKETGLKAYTEKEFFWSTIRWYFRNTGIPISFGTTILLGFIIGIAVCGQTFYMFVLENMRYLGALKAMGASTFLLSCMLLYQALVVGFIGFGLGVGLAAAFGYMAIELKIAYYTNYLLLLAALLTILFICSTAALIAIRRIAKLEAAEVFRG